MKNSKIYERKEPAISNFAARCYQAVALVPPGAVTTYSDIAHFIGSRAYRAVGRAMHCNPFAPQVPCHRVVCQNGALGGYAYGEALKASLLESEGVPVVDGYISNFQQLRFSFTRTARTNSR